MLSIKEPTEELYVINKSKFYSFAFPVLQENQAKDILDRLRHEYNDATHVCFAYVLSSPRMEKASDDGEPSGTAGKPLLELIKKKKLENVLIVSVRYFGGIKLGAGGLVRAYTNSGNLVLDKAQVVEVEMINKYLLTCDISIGSKVSQTIISLGGKVLTSRYLDKVNIEYIGEIQDKLLTMYSNNVTIQKIGSETVCQ